MNEWWFLFWLITALPVGVITHELGHYYAAKHQGGKARISWKGLYVEHNLTGDKRKSVVIGGLAAGYAPMLYLMWISVEIAIVYVLGWSMGVVTEWAKYQREQTDGQ